MTADDPFGRGAARERKQRIISDYETNPKRIKAVALLEYRCRQDGCLLLHVWRSPEGLLFYQPGFKQSPRLNAERSNAAGRARNMRGGDGPWNPDAGQLDDYRGWGPSAGLELRASMRMQCDHVDQTLPADGLLDEADAATPGRPTRRLI